IVHALPADGRDVRGENRVAGSQSASSRHRLARWHRGASSRRNTGSETLMAIQPTRKVHALGAEFPTAKALFEAAEKVRDAGFKRWDVHSPFPIHGMDKAMGLGKSWLSAPVLAGGITGLLTAAILEFGPSSIIYPLIVHGKPRNFWTVPAFFPIMFELTILFSAFFAFFSVLI